MVGLCWDSAREKEITVRSSIRKGCKTETKSATCDIQKIKGASRFELETCRSAVDRSTTELYALIFIKVT